MTRAIALLEAKNKLIPVVYLTPEAKKELFLVYGGSIPYEVFAFLAAMFPTQSEKNPVNEEQAGDLGTVIKFRQATNYLLRDEYYGKESLKKYLQWQISFLERAVKEIGI